MRDVILRRSGRYGILSLFLMVCIKEIFRQGRSYEFPRPQNCLKEGCGSGRIWKHGFIDAYFEGYETALCLRRYICADCGCVYTIRPFGYWPKHHAPIRIIVERICHRLTHGAWGRSAFTRQRQGHWIRALRNNIKTYLGLGFSGNNAEGLYALVHMGLQPVARLF